MFLLEVEGFEILALHQFDSLIEDLVVGAHIFLALVKLGVELLVEELSECQLFIELILAYVPQAANIL